MRCQSHESGQRCREAGIRRMQRIPGSGAPAGAVSALQWVSARPGTRRGTELMNWMPRVTAIPSESRSRRGRVSHVQSCARRQTGDAERSPCTHGGEGRSCLFRMARVSPDIFPPRRVTPCNCRGACGGRKWCLITAPPRETKNAAARGGRGDKIPAIWRA